MTGQTLEQINKEALGKVCLAHQILNKINSHPELYYAHDPILSKLGESRWNRHFVMDNLKEFNEMYSTINPNNIPVQVQEFVKEANNFFYGRRN